MKTLTRRKSTRHLIFGLLCLLPLLLILFTAFRTGDWNITAMCGQLETITEWPIISSFYDWFFQSFFDQSPNYYVFFVFYYFCYLMIVAVLDLMFDFFFAILDLFHSWLDKFGGDY